MITVRYRILQKLDFVIGFLVIWAVGLLIFWHLWGSCSPILTSYSCVDPQTPPDTPTGGSDKVPVTPVYVVEEHHEVLLYWFHAAEKGLIQRQGNVLLHIDGHSDGATPEYRENIPKFRSPSLRDIYNMMQRNDVFIFAAGITGLIRRYIWVWSPWDQDEDDPPLSDHHVIKVKLGTTAREALDGTVFEDVCLCMSAETDNADMPPGESCLLANLTNPYTPNGEIEIKRDQCKIKMEDGLLEIVSEDKAIRLMKSGHWITSLDSVILDIDEDYYGTEAAVQPLYDVMITERSMTWMKYFVSHIFCPIQPREELEADKFFGRLLDTLIHLKQFCGRMTNAMGLCKDEKAMREFAFNSIDVLFADIQHRNLESILCRSDTKVKKAINRLIISLFRYTVDQLKALKEVGICFAGSPRTLMYNPAMGMVTCDGYNRPNETAVRFYSPTAEEVTFRTSQLKVMLGSDGLHPGVVTVCRSMRDGYTPRKFFHRIEEDVLGVLKDVFKTVDDISIFYDPYLLGGVSGWPGRH